MATGNRAGLPRCYRPLLTGVPTEPEWREQFAAPALAGSRPRPGAAVLALVDGSRTFDEILGLLLVEGHPLEAIYAALHWLHDHGYLLEAPGTGAGDLSQEETDRYRSQIAVFGAIGGADSGRDIGPAGASGFAGQGRLKEAVVVLFGLGPSGQAFARALALAGIGKILAAPAGLAERALMPAGLSEEIGGLNPHIQFTLATEPDDIPGALGEVDPSLLVYCPERFDEPFCEWLNSVCLAVNVPLLLFRRRELDVEIGPLILPHQTACYVCYDLRRKAAASSQALMPDEDPAGPPGLAFPIGVDILALEAVKLLGRIGEPITRARLWRYSLLTGLAELHPVLKLPRCPACGAHGVKPPRKLWEEME